MLVVLMTSAAKIGDTGTEMAGQQQCEAQSLPLGHPWGLTPRLPAAAARPTPTQMGSHHSCCLLATAVVRNWQMQKGMRHCLSFTA